MIPSNISSRLGSRKITHTMLINAPRAISTQRELIISILEYRPTPNVAAKNDRAHECLAAQFKEHSITRSYRAILHGNLPEEEITIDAPIGRHPKDRKKMAVLSPGQGTSRRAVTHVKVIERFGAYTYVECVLETGRTHQIRVHMAHIGHPVLGDEVYGPKRCPFHLEGQTLHAMVLGFVHPSRQEYMEFTAPLPDYFIRLLELLRRKKESGSTS